jgi:hypothetical protein
MLRGQNGLEQAKKYRGDDPRQNNKVNEKKQRNQGVSGLQHQKIMTSLTVTGI